jgi:phosphatidylethanolamine-binding protein (PEBP) family uncharacterized protein
MVDMQLTSSAFSYGNEMPRKIGYKNGNISPPLTIGGIPAEAKSLTLIMDDPDAMGAVGKVWLHWLQYHNLTETSPIEGKTDFGEIGYGGPAPPDGKHTYIFKAYALDTELELKEGFSKQELKDAMKGHILAEAKLTGTFAP